MERNRNEKCNSNKKYNTLRLLIHSLPSNGSSSVDVVTLEITICDNYKTFTNLHTVQITTAHTMGTFTHIDISRTEKKLHDFIFTTFFSH
jgi:hypothetical protein